MKGHLRGTTPIPNHINMQWRLGKWKQFDIAHLGRGSAKVLVGQSKRHRSMRSLAGQCYTVGTVSGDES